MQSGEGGPRLGKTKASRGALGFPKLRQSGGASFPSGPVGVWEDRAVPVPMGAPLLPSFATRAPLYLNPLIGALDLESSSPESNPGGFPLVTRTVWYGTSFLGKTRSECLFCENIRTGPSEQLQRSWFQVRSRRQALGSELPQIFSGGNNSANTSIWARRGPSQESPLPDSDSHTLCSQPQGSPSTEHLLMRQALC